MAKLPECAACSHCGEYHRAALHNNDPIVCMNCSDTRHQHDLCAICGHKGPVEAHHIAGRRHASHTITVCLNCHAILSRWQYHWHASRESAHPLLLTIQGIIDITRLRYERMAERGFVPSIGPLLLDTLRLALSCLLPSLAPLADHIVIVETIL